MGLCVHSPLLAALCWSTSLCADAALCDAVRCFAPLHPCTAHRWQLPGAAEQTMHVQPTFAAALYVGSLRLACRLNSVSSSSSSRSKSPVECSSSSSSDGGGHVGR